MLKLNLFYQCLAITLMFLAFCSKENKSYEVNTDIKAINRYISVPFEIKNTKWIIENRTKESFLSVGPSDYSLYIKINVTNDDIKILKNKKYMGNETSSIFYPLEIAKLFLKKNEYNNFDAIKYVTIKGRMVNIQSFAKSPYTGNSGVLINNQLLMWLRTM